MQILQKRLPGLQYKAWGSRGSPQFRSSTTVPLHLCGGFLSAFDLFLMIDRHYIALGRRLGVLVKDLPDLSAVIMRQAPHVCASEGSFSASLPHPVTECCHLTFSMKPGVWGRFSQFSCSALRLRQVGTLAL